MALGSYSTGTESSSCLCSVHLVLLLPEKPLAQAQASQALALIYRDVGSHSSLPWHPHPAPSPAPIFPPYLEQRTPVWWERRDGGSLFEIPGVVRAASFCEIQPPQPMCGHTAFCEKVFLLLLLLLPWAWDGP